MGWLVRANEDDTAPYDLYIGYEGELKAKSLAYAFMNMTNLETIDGLEKIDTSNVTNMGYMFYGTALKTLDLRGWDTFQVTDMTAMFDIMKNITEIKGIENFKTSNVISMGLMFYGTALKTLDLRGWDTSQVANMAGMFATMTNIAEIKGIENFKTENVTDMQGMFSSTSLETLNLSNWDTSKVTNMGGMFSNMTNLTEIKGIENFKTNNVTNMSYMFQNTPLSTLDLSKWDTSQVKDMHAMFFNMTNLTEIKGIENFKTDNVTDMAYMFLSTKIATLDLSTWNTSQVTTMAAMFNLMTNLTEIKGIENFKTGNVTDMGLMFCGIPLTTLNLSNWDTSQVINMAGMFHTMQNLTKIEGIENFKTENVTSMATMFYMTALSTLDLRNWDTSKVTNMAAMFSDMTKLTEIQGIENFKTSNVTDMGLMFANTALSTLDLSKWDTSKVTTMAAMFAFTPHLTSLNMTSAKFTQVTNYENMFLSTNSNLKVTITGEDNKSWFIDHNILTADYLNVL